MAKIDHPSYRETNELELGSIRVSGVQGLQPASRAKWYLLRGYNVYHATTGESVIVQMIGEGQEAKYVLYAVADLGASEGGRHESDHDLGAYGKQFREVDDAVAQLQRYDPAIQRRGDSMMEDVLQPGLALLMIDATDSAELEMAQSALEEFSMSCRYRPYHHWTWLTYRTAKLEGVAHNSPRRGLGAGLQNVHQQCQGMFPLFSIKNETTWLTP